MPNQGIVNFGGQESGPLAGSKIIVALGADQGLSLVTPLEGEGAQVLQAPALPQGLKRPNHPAEKSFHDVMKELAGGKIDLVVFSSRPAVENFVKGLKKEGGEKILPKIRAASMGPLVSRAVRDAGLELVVQAREMTAESMVEAIRILYPGRATNADFS